MPPGPRGPGTPRPGERRRVTSPTRDPESDRHSRRFDTARRPADTTLIAFLVRVVRRCLKAMNRPSGDQAGNEPSQACASTATPSSAPRRFTYRSRPSVGAHTKASWLPSGESASWNVSPGRLRTGVAPVTMDGTADIPARDDASDGPRSLPNGACSSHPPQTTSASARSRHAGRGPDETRRRTDRREIGRECVGAGVAAPGVAVDGALDHARESRGRSGPKRQQIHPLPRCVRAPQFRERARAHRIGPGQQVIKQHTDAVDVAAGRRRAAGEHLRREVQRRSCYAPPQALPSSCPVPKSINTSRPSSATITFCALISRCRRPAAWTADTAPHSSRPSRTTSSGVSTAPSREHLLERAAPDELHPQANRGRRCARRRRW